jgi:hypothetical protein
MAELAAEHVSDRLACAHHEAGHAVSRWVLGYTVTSIEIHNSPVLDDDGIAIDGLTRIVPTHRNPISVAISSIAGPLCEAFYSDISIWDLVDGAGKYDFEMAEKALARAPFPLSLEEVGWLAVKLLNPRHHLVELVAEELAATGAVSGERFLELVEGVAAAGAK